ncbi:MAG: hypothetical protein RLZZ628_1930 [Bacteroidota bacterium]|jgi:hypothetical protein
MVTDTPLFFPKLSKFIFWDVAFDTLDYEKDKFFIIEKVMNYGLWEDFKALVQFYGNDIIKKEIKKSAYLKKDVLNFLCFYFHLKPHQFKCYTRRQSNPKHWDF